MKIRYAAVFRSVGGRSVKEWVHNSAGRHHELGYQEWVSCVQADWFLAGGYVWGLAYDA